MAFRLAVGGWALLAAAAVLTLVWSGLTYEFPRAIAIPGWAEWSRPLLQVTGLWGAILLWVAGAIMCSTPRNVRRMLAIRGFGEQRGLRFSRIGSAPPRVGIWFAEGSAPLASRRVRDRRSRSVEAPSARPLFRSQYALWSGPRADDPELQIAVATFAGQKNDPRGPRYAFRYLTMPLPRALPHLMVDSFRNGRLHAALPGVSRMNLEGDFDQHFAVYAPAGYGRDALELLTPDVMACLIDHGRRWDVEVVEDRLIVVSTRVHGVRDREEIPALLRFAELIGEELGHQAKTYSDPRAARPRSQVADAGRRLAKRSAVWSAVIVFAVLAIVLAFPFALMWLLER